MEKTIRNMINQQNDNLIFLHLKKMKNSLMENLKFLTKKYRVS